MAEVKAGLLSRDINVATRHYIDASIENVREALVEVRSIIVALVLIPSAELAQPSSFIHLPLSLLSVC